VNPPLAESSPLGAPGLVPDRKGGISFRLVALVFAVLLALGLTLALVIHRRYVGFERIATRHIPPDTALALRWDVEKVSLFEPTRRFLLPLLDATRAGAPPGETRRERMSRAAKLEVGRDLREVVVLFGPGAREWAVVFAGSFPDGDLVTPLLGALAPEGARAAGERGILTPDGYAFGRADDGAFVLASSSARLDAVLTPRAIPTGIARTGAGSLLVHTDEQVGLPAGAAELFAPLGELREVTAEAQWGNPLRIELALHFRHDPPTDLPARVHRAFKGLLGPDLARLEQRFGALTLQRAGNREVRIRLRLDDLALERAADRASRAVVSGLALRPVLE